MNQTITMSQAPAVRASRALRAVNVRKMCVRAISLARRKSLTLAVMSVIALYVGISLDSLPVTLTAAFAAIGFLYLADHSKKGGEA
ncbi:MAG: hypothetical protein ACI4AK_01620 [Lepagella sp.]